jgi:class 3 adenylate cyclase/tetratricopeptide (TPR) repeat protein
MKCTKCQADNPPSATFCVECGAKLQMQCPSCGQFLESRFKFCSHCGHLLSKPVALPDALSSIATAIDTPTEGERRQATVLFSDVSGYTAMNEQMDPEEVAEIMGQIKANAVTIVEAHGGIVNQFVGDEVLALFGIPTAHTDDPVRAVRAALALHEMMRGISPQFEQRLARRLRFHTGINTGLIVTGVRDNREGRVGVTGDTINVGARLRSLAQDDAILLGPETHKLVLEVFETERIEPVTIKGRVEQLCAYQLIAERAMPKRLSHSFVGRRTEMRQFTGIVEICKESGQGQTVYIRGEVGVGKSKLLDEFQAIASTHGFACHKGRVLDFGTANARDAVRSVVKSVLNIPIGAPEDIRRQAAARAVADGRVNESQALFLNDLLDVTQPAEVRAIYEAIDNEIRNRGKRETVCELVKRASATEPVMLMIEDLQWADAVTFGHLAALASTAAEVPLLVVMTSRLDGDPLNQTWRAASHGSAMTTIDLAPLRREEAVDLARQFLHLSPRFAERCVERAAGNPLFLTQLLRSAEESLDQSVPGSVQTLVQARVDNLPAKDREAIRTASIFGQSFSLEALRTLLGSTDYRCDTLVAYLFVRPEGDWYLFAHDLIQEGIYASLLLERRRQLHTRAAEWFAGRDLPLRAEHLDRAKDPRATQAFLEAARSQTVEFRLERALALAERGLELASDAPTRFSLKCCAGELLRKLARAAESIEAYREAERLAINDTQRWQTWIGQIEGMRLMDQNQDALALSQKAHMHASKNNLASELAQIHHLRGNLYFPLGSIDDCLREHHAALDWARKAGSHEAEARSLGGLGDAYYLNGRMKTANEHFRRCVDLCRQHALGQVEVANLPMVGWSGIYIDSMDQVLQIARAAAETARKVGHYRAESQARSLVGFAAMETGAFAEAKEQMNLALALSRKLKARRFEAHFLCDLGKLAEAQGHRSNARELVERALNICRDMGMSYIGPTVLGLHALVADDAEARAHSLKAAETILRKGCVSHNYFWFYRDAIEASLSTCDWDSLKRYADALEDYTRSQPLPWSDFFVARARALFAYGTQQRDDALIGKLRELSGEAHRLGLNLAARALIVAFTAR